MKRTMVPLIVAAALGSTAASATTGLHLRQSLSRISPVEFASRTTIEDDRLESAVILSTQRSARPEGPSKGAWIDDAHLRAVVDRETGRTTWQVWHDLVHTGSGREVSAVHYLVDGQLVQVQPKVVEHWLDHCPATDVPGQCNQYTRIVFELPEEHVHKISASHRPGSREPWLMRFKDRHGGSVTVGLAPAELAGLVEAYQTWRAGSRY